MLLLGARQNLRYVRLTDEPHLVAERYARRISAGVAGRYDPLNWDVMMALQERQRAMAAFLRRSRMPLPELRLLEVGCGAGRNLLELLLMGLRPGNMVGIELLPDRAEAARNILPSGVNIIQGDASAVGLPDSSFDVVYQSTVFTSILDKQFRQHLAAEMWRSLSPGGAVLWYDFTYDNPANPDVRGVPLSEVAELFPAGNVRSRKVTLAPPIARRVANWSPAGYRLFNLIPLLRTHVICWIEKGHQ